MKKVFLILFVAFIASISNAQITLEHAYNEYSLSLIKLRYSGYKYGSIDVANNKIVLYNLNHTLYKQFTIPIPWDNNMHFYYLTETLFDTDSTDIEYLVGGMTGTLPPPFGNSYLRVFDEHGNTLFSADSLSIQGRVSTDLVDPATARYIVNTDQGPKLIIAKDSSYLYRYYVYSLPGAIECAPCSDGIITGMENFTGETNYLTWPVPNPSSHQTTIEYQLPDNISSCDLAVYDMSGREIKRYRVTNRFSNIKLDVSEIPQGTYYYQLQTGDTNLAGKKMIIVR